MNDDTPFPFLTLREAWTYFTKAARIHFAKLIRQLHKDDPEFYKKIRFLKNRDYCARLLYILNMFAFEGDDEGEFDLDWAMLLSKPLSAAQARRSVDELILLGLMGIEDENEERKLPSDGTETNELRGISRREERDSSRRTPPAQRGGDTCAKTKFNFDE